MPPIDRDDISDLAAIQRRMLAGFAVAIVVMLTVPPAYAWLRAAAGEDLHGGHAIRQTAVVIGALRIAALAAFVMPAIQLVPRVGWSVGARLAFVVTCLASIASPPLLLVALFMVNHAATRHLRRRGIRAGLLGASRDEMQRFSATTTGPA